MADAVLLLCTQAAKRKAGKELLGEGGLGEGGLALDGSDEEAQAKRVRREAEEEQEFERAKERLTLKHKNTSRWVGAALRLAPL